MQKPIFNLNIILEKLKSKASVTSSFPLDSPWNNHVLVDKYDLEITHHEDQPLTPIQKTSLEYYFENEALIYKHLIAELTQNIEDFEDKYLYAIDEYLDRLDIENGVEIDYLVERTIDPLWLRSNMSLFRIDFYEEVKNHFILELKFMVNWDVEDGLSVLVYKDKIVGFGASTSAYINPVW